MGIILGIIIFILMVVFAVLGYCITDKISNEDDYKFSQAEQEKIRRKNKAYKFKSIVFWVLSGISLIAFILVPFSFHQVNTGEVAVVKKWGVAKEQKDSGLYFELWIGTKYEKYDAKVQEVKINTQAYSSDGQTMEIELVVQYQISNAVKISTNYGGLDMLESRISTVSIEKMKSTLSQKQAMTIIETRTEISPAVEEAIRLAITDDYYVSITTVVLTDISFTDTFESVIEDKMVAEQEKLKAQYEKEKAIIQAEQEFEVAKKQAEAQLEKAKKEAEAIEVKAEAEANALQIIQEAWDAIPEEVKAVMLQEMAIEKWDGKVPETMVGTDFLEWLMGSI